MTMFLFELVVKNIQNDDFVLSIENHQIFNLFICLSTKKDIHVPDIIVWCHDEYRLVESIWTSRRGKRYTRARQYCLVSRWI